jgi:hypothetical protein
MPSHNVAGNKLARLVIGNRSPTYRARQTQAFEISTATSVQRVVNNGSLLVRQAMHKPFHKLARMLRPDQFGATLWRKSCECR